MKAVMIAAPSSGSGKTTVTLGLTRALKQKGLDICTYKTGPDYIDRAFLEHVSGHPAGNLDLHIQGQEGMFHALSRAPAGLVLIEGVMGFFDGISNTSENSCHHISSLLDIPSILVYSPKGEMFSAIPKIKGMAEFEHSSIKAVLFNHVTERYYTMLREALEQHVDVPCIGYLPRLPQAEVKSRHLGLIQVEEIEDIDARIDQIAAAAHETVDLDAILNLMVEPGIPETTVSFEIPETGLRVGIARDHAFSFYYRENIELLESCCRVVPFSPLSDSALPACDLLYFGGGYPEIFRGELSRNRSMLSAVKEYGERGGFIFAECGGLMYLSGAIEGVPMVGLLEGDCRLTKTLQRFGYIDMQLSENCMLGREGDRLTGHEFHRSTATIDQPTVYRISKTGGDREWTCGFRYKNVIAGYPHLNFLGNMEILKHLLNTVKQSVMPA